MLINGVTLNPDQFYSPHEAAEALGVKEATLAAYRCRAGTLPFMKLGRRVRYRGSDLIAFITNAAREPGADPARSAAARDRAVVRFAKARSAA